MHSTTKYLNGHSDMVGGVAGGRRENAELRERARPSCRTPSARVAGPFDSFLALRGVKTLALRMERHCANALAHRRSWLERAPDGRAGASIPASPAIRSTSWRKRQMRGFGGMVTVDPRPRPRRTRAASWSAAELFTLAESLGGVESLIEHPAIMTHASIPPRRRDALGIADGWCRLSVGIEDADDLIADLDAALG